jgi:hypothetical protein
MLLQITQLLPVMTTVAAITRGAATDPVGENLESDLSDAFETAQCAGVDGDGARS